jgi:hypothetical protein
MGITKSLAGRNNNQQIYSDLIQAGQAQLSRKLILQQNEFISSGSWRTPFNSKHQ